MIPTVNIKIGNNELTEMLVGNLPDFPKYTTQILNIANRNAQGTRPKVVGQMSELIQQFGKEAGAKEYKGWVEWYSKKQPHAVDAATEKIYEMVGKLKETMGIIDKNLVRKWVQNLVFTNTYVGLRFQEAILIKVAGLKNTTYKRSPPNEESKGIDGYIGGKPVSVKPITYKTMNMLPEQIKASIIYYEKKKDGISIEFDF